MYDRHSDKKQMKSRWTVLNETDSEGDSSSSTTTNTSPQSLLNSELFSDVQLKFKDGVVVFAHKAVLSRSKLFLAMFSSTMVESQQKEVQIGYNSQSFLVFLEYLYTNTLEFKEGTELEELLMIADEYMMDEVKKKCAKTLVRDINVTNVCDILSYAVKYNVPLMQKTCLELIKKNIWELHTSGPYRQLKTEAPHVMKIIDDHVMWKAKFEFKDFSKSEFDSHETDRFTVDDNQWTIDIYPRGRWDVKNQFVSVFLRRKDDSKFVLNKLTEIYIHTNFNFSLTENHEHLDNIQVFTGSSQIGFNQWLPLDQLDQYLKDDVLVLYAQIAVLKKEEKRLDIDNFYWSE